METPTPNSCDYQVVLKTIIINPWKVLLLGNILSYEDFPVFSDEPFGTPSCLRSRVDIELISVKKPWCNRS